MTMTDTQILFAVGDTLRASRRLLLALGADYEDMADDVAEMLVAVTAEVRQAERDRIIRPRDPILRSDG